MEEQIDSEDALHLPAAGPFQHLPMQSSKGREITTHQSG
jgi:hypothetical protein